MGATRSRLVGAVVFVAVACAPYYAQALAGWDGEGPFGWPVFIAVMLAFLLAGLVIGRWWAVGLLLLIPLLLWPLGQDPDDSDGWYYASLFVFGPLLFGAPLLIVGLAASTVLRWRRGEFAPSARG